VSWIARASSSSVSDCIVSRFRALSLSFKPLATNREGAWSRGSQQNNEGEDGFAGIYIVSGATNSFGLLLARMQNEMPPVMESLSAAQLAFSSISERDSLTSSSHGASASAASVCEPVHGAAASVLVLEFSDSGD
jgi:hypothetical protein